MLRVRCRGPLGCCSPVCLLGVLCCVCRVLGHLAPVHQCGRLVRCFACVVSWATWLLFTDVPARCVVWRVRCPGPLGSCSPVRPLGVSHCLYGLLGPSAPVHRCARSVCCVWCAVSWAPWLLFTGVPAPCVALRVRRPRPLGPCSLVCPLGVLCCVCGVLGHSAPVHRCACSVCCIACAVSWRLGSCSAVCPLGVFCCSCGVLGDLAPVHWCARSVCCVGCAVSWAPWLLFTGVPAPCVALRVRCPGPLGSCSQVSSLNVLCCVCGVLGHLAPVHRCARSVCCVACAVSWATWLLFIGVPAGCVVFRVRCSGPLCSCSPVCLLPVLRCVCGVLGPLAPVHRCACSLCCVACAVFWANWLLFTGVPARCVLLLVRCPGPLGSCSRMCPLGVLCCVCGVLGKLAPVHRCCCSVRRVACTVSWAPWLLFTGVSARCAVLGVRCPGPLDSCSPVCPLCVLRGVCGVLGPLAPVQRCPRSVCCVGCAVSWATWLLFTGVPAHCAVLRVRCSGPIGFCSPVCPLGVFCCSCGALGHLATVHRCARSVYCAACAVSWATWLLFTGAAARCVVLRVRCPGLLAFCSPVCPLCVLCCVCGVLGPLAPVHRCARLMCCAMGCMCGGALRSAHSSIRTAAVRSRQGLGTLRARTRPSGRRLFSSRQGLGSLWARTRPSGRRLFRSRQGLGSLLGAHTSVRTVTGVAWHLLRVVTALSGFAAPGDRCCLAPVRVPWFWPAGCLSGVPHGPGWCAAPRPVLSLSVLRSAFLTPWCLSPPRGLKESPYQDRPLLCPFRLSPLLTCS